MIEAKTEGGMGDGQISVLEISSYLEVGILLGTALFSVISGFLLARRNENKKKRASEKEKTLKDKEQELRIFDDKNEDFLIYDRLMYLRIKSSADRVRLCQFHNGGKFLSGNPMKKFTCTHETTSKGVSNESDRIQNCLTTVFLDKILVVKENDPRVRRVSDLLVESKSKSFYKSNEVDRYALLPIYKSDLIIGFVEVEWNEGSINEHESDFNSLFTLVRSQVEFEMMKGG